MRQDCWAGRRGWCIALTWCQVTAPIKKPCGARGPIAPESRQQRVVLQAMQLSCHKPAALLFVLLLGCRFTRFEQAKGLHDAGVFHSGAVMRSSAWLGGVMRTLQACSGPQWKHWVFCGCQKVHHGLIILL